MPFIVLYDACVLHPAPLRDFLIRLARTGIFRAVWSDRILDECFRSILAARPDLDQTSLARTRELMNRALPDSLVRNYEPLMKRLTLPDPDDRHVLAAAIRSEARVILTQNVGDFPESVLEAFEITAQTPDDFVSGLIELSAGTVLATIREQAAALKSPPRTVFDLLRTLEKQRLPCTVTQLRALIDSGKS